MTIKCGGKVLEDAEGNARRTQVAVSESEDVPEELSNPGGVSLEALDLLRNLFEFEGSAEQVITATGWPSAAPAS